MENPVHLIYAITIHIYSTFNELQVVFLFIFLYIAHWYWVDFILPQYNLVVNVLA